MPENDIRLDKKPIYTYRISRFEDFTLSPSGNYMVFTDIDRTKLAISEVKHDFKTRILYYKDFDSDEVITIYKILFDQSERFLVAMVTDADKEEDFLLVYQVPEFKLSRKIPLARSDSSPRHWRNTETRGGSNNPAMNTLMLTTDVMAGVTLYAGPSNSGIAVL